MYQIATPEVISTVLMPESDPVTRQVVHTVSGSASTADGLGSRSPTILGRPIWPGRRGGAGLYSDASLRSLVTTTIGFDIL